MQLLPPLRATNLPHTPQHTHTQEIEGWLWFDEKDQINVLARLAPDQQSHQRKQQEKKKQQHDGKGGGQFLLFEQRKYGYEGLRYVVVDVHSIQHLPTTNIFTYVVF